MTSCAVQVRQSWLRPVPALRGRRRAGRIAFQPLVDVVVVELLAPEQPGERLPLDAPRVVGHAVRAERAVERVGLGLALRRTAPSASPNGLAPGLVGQPQQHRLGRAGRDRDSGSARPLSCPTPCRVHGARASPWTTASWMPSFTYGELVRASPQPLRRCVSFSVNSSAACPAQASQYSPSAWWCA